MTGALYFVAVCIIVLLENLTRLLNELLFCVMTTMLMLGLVLSWRTVLMTDRGYRGFRMKVRMTPNCIAG